MGSILSSAPLNLIDLLFYFKGFEVVEFGFVRLKFRMELILARFFLGHVRSFAMLLKVPFSQSDAYCLIPLKKHNSTTLITSCEVVAGVVEFNC
jgi:hypothetical protein